MTRTRGVAHARHDDSNMLGAAAMRAPGDAVLVRFTSTCGAMAVSLGSNGSPIGSVALDGMSLGGMHHCLEAQMGLHKRGVVSSSRHAGLAADVASAAGAAQCKPGVAATDGTSLGGAAASSLSADPAMGLCTRPAMAAASTSRVYANMAMATASAAALLRRPSHRASWLFSRTPKPRLAKM